MNKVLYVFLVIFGTALFVFMCWVALWAGQWLYENFGLGGMMLLCTYIICVNIPRDKSDKKGR